MRLGEISWTQAKTAFDQGASAIIPLGSIEEHGPHVPMGDYVVIDEIARRASEAPESTTYRSATSSVCSARPKRPDSSLSTDSAVER